VSDWIPVNSEQEDIKAGRCSLGRIEYGNDRYCYTHGGFQHERGRWCDKAVSTVVVTGKPHVGRSPL